MPTARDAAPPAPDPFADPALLCRALASEGLAPSGWIRTYRQQVTHCVSRAELGRGAATIAYYVTGRTSLPAPGRRQAREPQR